MVRYLEQCFDDRHSSARLTSPDAHPELSRRTNCVSISVGRAVVHQHDGAVPRHDVLEAKGIGDAAR